jgi:hypothetical protein
MKYIQTYLKAVQSFEAYVNYSSLKSCFRVELRTEFETYAK